MPPLSSRLNVKNLENSDLSDTTSSSGNKATFTGSSDNETRNSSIRIHRREKQNDEKESSNDASNETSDSDKSLIAQTRRPSKTKLLASGRNDAEENNAGDNEADDELPAEVVEEASTTDDVPPSEKAAPLEKRFFCSTCNQGFTRKHNMVSHELIHLSSKPHVCSLCSALFRRIHDLKRHEKLHTGEKPFHCDKCNRRFARTDALTRHLNSPNACSGKEKGDEASLALVTVKSEESTTERKPTPTSGSSSSSSSAHSTDLSRKTTSSTDITNEDQLGKETRPPKRTVPRDLSLVAASVSSDSLGGISDTINKANYDVHRWRAFQHQQSSQMHGKRFPYNTTTTTTTTTVTTQNEHGEKEKETRHVNHLDHIAGQSSSVNASFPQGTGQHYHHHYHHHHHHEDESERNNRRTGMESWSIPSDREMHNDGQFRKHDEYYPRDIRASRKDSDLGHSGDEYHSKNDAGSGGPYGPKAPFKVNPPSSEGFHPSNVYSSYSDGHINQRCMNPGQLGKPPMTSWPLQQEQLLSGSSNSSRSPVAMFVPMEKYTDLLNYTNDLQASLTKMDDRIKFLERAEHKREAGEATPELQEPQKKRKQHDS